MSGRATVSIAGPAQSSFWTEYLKPGAELLIILLEKGKQQKRQKYIGLIV